MLTPLAIDPAHPFPFIPNMGIVMVLKLHRDEDNTVMSALIPLPSQVERFIRLPPRGESGESIRFVLLEDLVSLSMHLLFPGFRVLGKGMFRLIRDNGLSSRKRPKIWSGPTRPLSSADAGAFRSNCRSISACRTICAPSWSRS